MTTSRLVCAAALVILASLTACATATAPAIDWETAEQQADAFLEQHAASSDFAGGGTIRLETGLLPDGTSQVNLSHAPGDPVLGFTLACFGDGTAAFTFATTGVENLADTQALPIPCDGAEISLPFPSETTDFTELQLIASLSEGAGVLAVAVHDASAELIAKTVLVRLHLAKTVRGKFSTHEALLQLPRVVGEVPNQLFA